MGIATWLLVALTLLFQLGASGKVHPAEEENINSAELTPSFRASKLLIPQKIISKLTTKASSRPITTTKRIGRTTKPIKKNQQLQKKTPKKNLVQQINSKAKSFITTKKLAQLKKTTQRDIIIFPEGAMFSLDMPPVDPKSLPPEEAILRVAAEVNEDYGNLTSTELSDLYDDLTSTSATLNTTEVPDASTVEDVTRTRLKRRKTTTSDPATSTKRRLKRTRTTTVGPENA